MFLSSQHLRETSENRGWTSTVQLQQSLALRPAGVTEMEMSAFNLDGSLPPHSLNNHLPKALLPTASLSSSTHPMGQEPQHHWTLSPQIHTNTGLQLGTNISATSIPFCDVVPTSPIWSADYHQKNNQFFTCLLAAGVSPPNQLTCISVGTVHLAQCHTSRESLCLWLELRRKPLPCPSIAFLG